MNGLASLPDSELIRRLQRAAFEYFLCYSHPHTGLVADTSREKSPCSIAAVGFALSCYPVAVRNEWLTRSDAANRTLKVLRFLSDSTQSGGSAASGYQGFYYHFLDMNAGHRVWECELSMIDTALLMAGIAVALTYFDGDDEEVEIRERAQHLYRRVDWRWAQNGSDTLAQGWKPETGFLHYGWEGYNEALILYTLGLGSPTFPLTAAGYQTWGLTYQRELLLEQDVLYAGPLFTHLFSHAWIDFRGIRDSFMREMDCDYFENSQRAIALHREYGERNPGAFRHTAGISGGFPPATGPGTTTCANTIRIFASLATWREVCPTVPTTVRFHLGRCWPRCPSIRRPPSRVPADFWLSFLKSVPRVDSPAGSIPRCRPGREDGCPTDGTRWTRGCWS